MNYAYLRTSTKTQDSENQKYQILTYTNSKGIQVHEWIDETVSGTLAYEKRDLGKVIEKLQPEDSLIVSELSRLGRSLMDVMSLLNKLINNKVKVFSIKENFELGDNLNSKVLAFAFSLSAEIERQLISQRTKEALQRKKSEGKSLGRPLGYRMPTVKLSGQEAKIKELLGYGVSYRSIGRMLNVHPNTVTHFVKTRNLRVK